MTFNMIKTYDARLSIWSSHSRLGCLKFTLKIYLVQIINLNKTLKFSYYKLLKGFYISKEILNKKKLFILYETMQDASRFHNYLF